MKLFDTNHFPVVSEGTKFDFSCSLPEEDLISIDIRKTSVEVKPTTKHDGTNLLELTDYDKQRLFDIVINIDNIRMLGKQVTLLVCLTATKPVLYSFEIDGKRASAEQRQLLCTDCNLEDSVVCRGVTLYDFFRHFKLRYHSYDAVTEDGQVYQFTVSDIASYTSVLNEKAEEAKREANRIRVVYSSPGDSDDTKEKIRQDAERKQKEQELEKDIRSLIDGLEQVFDETRVFRSMADLYRIFSRW